MSYFNYSNQYWCIQIADIQTDFQKGVYRKINLNTHKSIIVNSSKVNTVITHYLFTIITARSISPIVRGWWWWWCWCGEHWKLRIHKQRFVIASGVELWERLAVVKHCGFPYIRPKRRSEISYPTTTLISIWFYSRATKSGGGVLFVVSPFIAKSRSQNPRIVCYLMITIIIIIIPARCDNKSY